MSKNVAVFVDVANIFYAAKAAGVDIDYVTLLKSATAGRDFVRAYAYTGLDPENENQRQFHSFLARNGYRVVSKDIRKYGDGRIKANLDIELVVDLMRMARNLDIAVVVSGDGDFAPAIRAVQQMGVRVEVISFRGNTSSDLIEVADSFTDIAQIARVEKGSARSGRRVAAEGDLSMTEVPEKETEGMPRRQRARRTPERGVAAAAAAAAAPETGGNLIVLPGERLSRAADEADAAEELEEADGLALAAEDEDAELGASGELADEAARRRRRRRGGRGRGRGRRGEAEVAAEPLRAAEALPSAEAEEEEEFEELPPAPLPHHTFGSVWDSQLGVPTVALNAGSAPVEPEEDEELEEPEIPEYLLAERRQRGQRGQRGQRMGRGGRAAGYQAALERERFGRTGTGGFAGARPLERARPERQRGPRPQQPRQGRPDRQAPPRAPERQQSTASAGGAPWSEVPPELEELLRAELARKQAPAQDVTVPEPAVDDDGQAPRAAAGQPSRRPRRRQTAAESEAGRGPEASPGPEASAESDASAETAEKPKRAPRRRTTTAAEPERTAAPEQASAETAEKPKRAPRRRTTTAAEPEKGAPPEQGSAETAEKPKRAPRRRSSASGAEPVAPESAEGGQ